MAAVIDDEATTTFVGERRRLVGIARRVLAGGGADAEDVVQDAWLRWQRYDWSAVENPSAFLATTTTRLAINATQTARARRETTAPSRRPEPVDATADPTVRAERVEAIEQASRVVLEALTASERAAFVLREAFAYPYDRIADVVGSTEVNARQLVSRARRRVGGGRRGPSDPAHRRRFAGALRAAVDGDLGALEAVLREDVGAVTAGSPARS